MERIKRFMTIMDSFTQEELDSDMKIFNATPNRLVRIARGAGVQLRHVHEVLETYKPFKKVASKMGGLASMMGGANGMMDPKKMTGRQGQMNMNKLGSMFTPQMLQQMGKNESDQRRDALSDTGAGAMRHTASSFAAILTASCSAPCCAPLSLRVPPSGGMGGLQNMMKQFASGGMPGMGGVSARAETHTATRVSAISLPVVTLFRHALIFCLLACLFVFFVHRLAAWTWTRCSR